MHKIFRSLLVGTLVIAAAQLVLAAQAPITVKDAWVRATVGQQKVTGAFMQIQSIADAKLVAASSPIADMVEIHEMAMDNNMMKMREVSSIDLPAGKLVELKSGGFHIMMMGLKKAIKEGDDVILQLTIETKDKKRQVFDVTAKVRSLNASSNNLIKKQ